MASTILLNSSSFRTTVVRLLSIFWATIRGTHPFLFLMTQALLHPCFDFLTFESKRFLSLGGSRGSIGTRWRLPHSSLVSSGTSAVSQASQKRIFENHATFYDCLCHGFDFRHGHFRKFHHFQVKIFFALIKMEAFSSRLSPMLSP